MITQCCCSCRGKYNYLGRSGSYGQMRKICWLGVHSGQVHAPRIEETRLVQQDKVLTLSSSKPDYEDNEVPLGIESFVRQGA
jgi:hypothetical protein